MVSATIKSAMLNVIMLSVVGLNVVAYFNCTCPIKLYAVVIFTFLMYSQKNFLS
jgi:hypothetical protein